MASRKKKASTTLSLDLQDQKAGAQPRLAKIPQNVTVRQMELKDVSAAFHLGEICFGSNSFPQLYRTWNPLEVTDSLASDPELCLVAEQLPKGKDAKGKVVGFVLGSITEKRRKDQSCGYLSWVAVAESHQRKQIGTRLVQHLMKIFYDEDIRTMIADTPRENDPATSFLKKLGFGSPVHHIYTSLNISNKKKVPSQPLSAEARTIKIRELKIDDLSAVHELGDQIYRADLYPNLFRIWSEAEVVELYGSDQETCFVAEQAGKVVGFCLGTILEKERNSWRYGYLIWLGVSPEVQRLGVGRRLYNAFHELMLEKHCRIIMVDTQADNEPARRFFERAGFASVEEHVYFSRTINEEDLPPELLSGEAVADGRLPSPVMNKQGSLGGGVGGKPFGLFKFKRAHSLSDAAFLAGDVAGVGQDDGKPSAKLRKVEEKEEAGSDEEEAEEEEEGKKKKGGKARKASEKDEEDGGAAKKKSKKEEAEGGGGGGAKKKGKKEEVGDKKKPAARSSSRKK